MAIRLWRGARNILAAIAAAVIVWLAYSAGSTSYPPSSRVCFITQCGYGNCPDTSCVGVEVAATEDKLRLGLMNRTSLEEDRGMLFVFDEQGQHPFWMKNTLIPLDMIWVDSGMVIVGIAHAVPCKADPCGNYYTTNRSAYVVEVNAGYAEKHGIGVGDRVRLEIANESA